jgi:hypothetical protein
VLSGSGRCVGLVIVRGGAAECGVSEWGVSECGVSECGVSECGVSECGVSECDSEVSIMRKTWSTRGCCVMDENNYVNTDYELQC